MLGFKNQQSAVVEQCLGCANAGTGVRHKDMDLYYTIEASIGVSVLLLSWQLLFLFRACFQLGTEPFRRRYRSPQSYASRAAINNACPLGSAYKVRDHISRRLLVPHKSPAFSPSVFAQDFFFGPAEILLLWTLTGPDLA